MAGEPKVSNQMLLQNVGAMNNLIKRENIIESFRSKGNSYLPKSGIL